MHYRNLPHTLRKRIRAFYHSFWSRGIYFNENAILGDLTFQLQQEVARFLNHVRVPCPVRGGCWVRVMALLRPRPARRATHFAALVRSHRM